MVEHRDGAAFRFLKSQASLSMLTTGPRSSLEYSSFDKVKPWISEHGSEIQVIKRTLSCGNLRLMRLQHSSPYQCLAQGESAAGNSRGNVLTYGCDLCHLSLEYETIDTRTTVSLEMQRESSSVRAWRPEIFATSTRPLAIRGRSLLQVGRANRVRIASGHSGIHFNPSSLGTSATP